MCCRVRVWRLVAWSQSGRMVVVCRVGMIWATGVGWGVGCPPVRVPACGAVPEWGVVSFVVRCVLGWPVRLGGRLCGACGVGCAARGGCPGGPSLVGLAGRTWAECRSGLGGSGFPGGGAGRIGGRLGRGLRGSGASRSGGTGGGPWRPLPGVCR